MVEGKCIIVSAPSGAGKTTIVHKMLEMYPELEFSISATSRPKRGEEVNGKDYYFLSEKDFTTKTEANAFLEWEEVYPGQSYGTLRSEINRIWEKGNTVIFDVDVIGGLNLKKVFGDQAMSLFIMPPSIDALRERLTFRSTESEEKIQLRLGKAAQELDKAKDFDKVIVNDNLAHAIADTEQIIAKFLNS